MQQIQIHPPDKEGAALVVTNVGSGIPQTRAEYQALVLKRQELSDQRAAAASRRRELAERLDADATPAARAEVNVTLKTLDARIARLETEIERTSDLLASAPPAVFTEAEVVQNPPMNFDPDTVVPVVGMVSVFVLLPFSIAIARLIWKRAGVPPAVPVADHATQRRLEQIQQSIDAIAVEVERISEGQRFVSKMMSERDQHAIGAGAAEALRTAHQASVSSERG